MVVVRGMGSREVGAFAALAAAEPGIRPEVEFAMASLSRAREEVRGCIERLKAPFVQGKAFKVPRTLLILKARPWRSLSLALLAHCGGFTARRPV